MTGEEIIKEVQEIASEWLEMTDNPTGMMVGILAHQVAQLHNRIEYLEKRLGHVSTGKNRIN